MGNAIFSLLFFLINTTVAVAQPGTHSNVSADTSVPAVKTNSSTPPLFSSKYDFVPGEKVIIVEDFSNIETGDFPRGWNTNASAEVVTVRDQEGKWLKIAKQGSFYPEMIKSLPQDMTLEFYLQGGSKTNPVPFIMNFVTFNNPEEFKYADGQNPALRGKPVLQLKFWPEYANKPASSEIITGRKGPNYDIQNKNSFNTWNKNNPVAHVALWRQADRLRVYINGEKVWDVQRAFDTSAKYNIVFAIPRTRQVDDYYLLGNMRLAVGIPDTRKKLLKEGRFVTQGILFNSGSDQIKPESYGILKEIATVLRESSSIRLKIVGHTDNEGDEQANRLLSQRRAVAVKSALVNNMGIKPDQLDTDGMGESKPIADNKTNEGRAQNRRVEFIKM